MTKGFGDGGGGRNGRAECRWIQDYNRTWSPIVYMKSTGTGLPGPGARGMLLNSVDILDTPFQSWDCSKKEEVGTSFAVHLQF